MWRLSLSMSMLLLAQNVSATIFSTIHTAQPSSLGANRAAMTYDYGWTIEDWDTTPGSSSSTAPNPCYGLGVCTIAINQAQDGGVGGSVLSQANPQCRLTAAEGTTGVRSMGELGDLYKKKCALPRSGIIQNTPRSTKNNAECVGLFYSTTGDRHASNGRLLPGSRCVDIAPRYTSCWFIYPATLFNHYVQEPGTIASGGSVMTASISGACSTGGVRGRFHLPGNRANLGTSGIYSLFMGFDGKGIDGRTFTADAGTGFYIAIRSILMSPSTAISSGVHSGTAVLTISLY